MRNDSITANDTCIFAISVSFFTTELNRNPTDGTSLLSYFCISHPNHTKKKKKNRKKMGSYTGVIQGRT
jgi:hypothetical protein